MGHHAVCSECTNREKCKRPCKEVERILRSENRVMERHYPDYIVCYPKREEVHFSDLVETKFKDSGKALKAPDDFSNEEAFQFATDDLTLRKTQIFIERFFNRIPVAILAEHYGVTKNSIVTIYKQAIEHIEKLVDAMESRRAGLKAVKSGRFSDDQKWFLLVHIFGFSAAEVARMFNRDRNVLGQKIKRMADSYAALFEGHEARQESSIDDPPFDGKLTRNRIVTMVETYTEQGLSHRDAFKRIAERYGEAIKRKVNYRGIESRYYRATQKAET